MTKCCGKKNHPFGFSERLAFTLQMEIRHRQRSMAVVQINYSIVVKKIDQAVKMNDTQAPPVGTEGTVRGVDDLGSYG